ncbi:hypothetical protein CN692_23775 [Bacillus sp. AFS002410]|uniref:spore germination protein n=1 Tax=Bacillus sp. AFS002410 TaxID=2033481 RepID=UPI000BEF7467|nr:hypothetical protein CN692_23775 [Bacillus sp. AFS002410]
MIRNKHKLLRTFKSRKNEEINVRQDPLYDNYGQNIEAFELIFDNCSDVIFRSFLLFGNTRATIIYIEGLTDKEGIENFVLVPLMEKVSTTKQSINDVIEDKIPVSKVNKVISFQQCIDSISSGNPILLSEGVKAGFSLGLAKWEKRSIEEPTAEVGIKGPREGFNESIEISKSQLRRIIKSPSLKMLSLKIGRYTNTTIVITYIEGIADQTLIDEIVSRLTGIEVDGILESEYIEELIEDNAFSPFPQILSTERPDVVCSNLLEGRVGILVEGTPFCLIAPISFFSLIQSHEDYYQRFIVSSAIRWLRYLFLGISLLLPSFYVAIMTFHQEMVPTNLLLSMAASREPIPFPSIVEVLIMEVSFEALREAGVRLPKQIGAAVSIVGALVIGQAAVQAGLVSSPMVIVVAITGIASFMLPRYIAGIAIRLLRFPMILLAGSLGLVGIMLGIILIVIHLCSLRSFGVPYLSPLAPLKTEELKDVLWRAPFWMMDKRPHLTGKTNLNRQSDGQSPKNHK